MATNSRLDRNAILAARQGLVPARSSGWMGGFGNMLSKELGDWFSTRRWIVQTIIWLAIVNGLMAFIIFVAPAIDPSAQLGLEEQLNQDINLYFNFAILFGSIGMIILAQDEIIQEKQTGTAAWILSKPVSRNAFILSKLFSNFFGGLIFIAGLTGIVTLAMIYLATQIILPILPFLAGIGVVVLALTFYLSLVIMLGTIFEQRGAVLGIAVGVLIGGLIASQFTPLVSYFLPVSMPMIAQALVQGQPIPTIGIAELVTTAAWSILFTLVSLWRFRQDEF
jgi:ABC-2 type transport system permease protein